MTTAPSTSAVPGGFAPAARNGLGPPASVGPPGPPTGAAADRLPRTRRQRRPAVAAAGALLVLLCGVASAALATAGDDRVGVLALARDVQTGQVLTAADLRVARLSGDGLSALSADGAATLVGQTVTATLPAGTLLNDSMLTATPLPAAGQQVVAIAVKAGGVPVEARPGRDVTLVQVQPAIAAGTAAGAGVLVPKARVVSVQADPASGSLVLSVAVPAGSAVAVAQASAAGAIAVTLLPVSP